VTVAESIIVAVAGMIVIVLFKMLLDGDADLNAGLSLSQPTNWTLIGAPAK
jgi:hypothetical protein